MKKILLLFVVMLGTLGAYAQSNTTPIKGDVNDDGVVDVADINAIIAIMKDGGGTVTEHKNNYYIGVTEKEVFTEDDLNQYVAERPSKITIPAGKYGTWIYPASWGKPISAISNLSNYDEVSAFNYSDLKLPNGYTGMWIELSSETTYTLTWPEYTWYKGMATEQEIQTQSYIDGLSPNQTTKPTDTITMNVGFNVMLFPSSWGIPTLWEDIVAGIYTARDLGINNPTGYNVIVYEALSESVTLYVKWKDDGGTVTEYTWYKGLATEQEIQTQSYIDGLSPNQTTKPTDTITMNKGYNVMLFPSSWGIPTLVEGGKAEAGIYTARALGINNPTGYNVIVYEAPSKSVTLYVEWK